MRLLGILCTIMVSHYPYYSPYYYYSFPYLPYYKYRNYHHCEKQALNVDFGALRGKAIRENYMPAPLESIDGNGSTNPGKIFKNVAETTTSNTYHSPTSLFSATLFTQKALTPMEKPVFGDMRSCGLI